MRGEERALLWAPPGALYHRGYERDVEAHRVGDTIHLLTGRCG